MGPDQYGRFPDEQLVPLRGLGAWLQTNGSAIYGTAPWHAAEALTTEGTEVRFTQRDGALNAILLDLPTREFAIRGIDSTALTGVRMLGMDQPIEWRVDAGTLHLRLPDRVPASPAHVLVLGHGVRPMIQS